MTSASVATPSEAEAVASSLKTLIAPHATEVFFERYYESLPLLVSRGEPNYFGGVLSLDDIDRIVTGRSFHHPGIFLVDAERDVSAEAYTRAGDEIDVVRLFQLHAAGATIVLNQFHASHPPLADLCAGLELEFSGPFQTNVYLTPPRARGFKAHFDTHDVFILQLHGSKHWRLYGTPIVLPLSGQGNEAVQYDPGPPVTEFDLNAGDTLYIPRGLVHDALSRDDTSLHVTVGILTYTWTDLLLESLAATVLSEPAFRRSLPPGFAQPGFDRTAARGAFRTLLERFSSMAGVDSALDAFIDEFISTRRPGMRGQMEQLRALQDLTLETVLARRPYLAYSLHEDQAGIQLRCHGNQITFPRRVSAAVRHALTTPRFRVDDLPGELDSTGKLVLVRRLVREGVLMAVLPAAPGMP